MSHDYAATAERLANGEPVPDDAKVIMSLLGYEVAPHARLGQACRPIGESHWQSLPSWRSADDALLWIPKTGARLDDAGTNQSNGRPYYVAGVECASYGNDYGEGPTLGFAIWAAFVRLLGCVDDGE